MKKIFIVLALVVCLITAVYAGQNITQDANRQTMVLYTEYVTTASNSVSGALATLRWNKADGTASSGATYTVPAGKFLNIGAMTASCHPTAATTVASTMTIKFYANGIVQGAEKIVSCPSTSVSSAIEFPDFPFSINGGIVYGPTTTLGITCLVSSWSGSTVPELDVTMYGYEYQ